MIIKKLYQFARILNGEPYNWYFKIQESARDKDSSGSRQDLIRLKIRDRLKSISPIFYNLIKSTYKTQIRNSIAHSNYSLQGRHISLNNFIKGDKNSALHGISFDDWVDIFHNTLIFHNIYIKLNNMINSHYIQLALNYNNEMEISITEKNGKYYSAIVEYRPELNDWKYKI